MITLKFDHIRRGNGHIIIQRGEKGVQFLEEHGIEFTIPYDDIAIKEDTVVELPLTTFSELNVLCQTYNATLLFDNQDCFIEFI